MKKVKLIIGATILFSMLIISCKEVKDESHKHESGEEHADHKNDESNEVAMVKYQCPMKCEGEKTYDKAGACPVCKMDMKAVKEGENHDEKDEHNEETEHKERDHNDDGDSK